ncbi:MAG: DUF2341 domain-containing protein, partial [Verrucomicrobiae bacterium]|nr:DUF2341 domain-containing protein [Verrucomicrobiae bacterium]
WWLAGAIPAMTAFIEVNGYTPQTMEGWSVYVSNDLLENRPEETEKALELIRGQCRKVIDVVTPAAVSELQKVALWVSLPSGDRRPRAEFHPDKAWLIEHGMYPEKAKGVEFTNIAILEEEIIRMPMLLLHELAHAYHNLVLGFDHPAILALYKKAEASGRYDRVKRHNREPQKAYAMTDHKEYFAECTEAYFGENDFYPFNSRELQQHDPEMYDLLTEIWIEGKRH